LVVPGVGVDTIPRGIDLERLRPIRHLDVSRRYEPGRRLLRQPEGLDPLRTRLADPHLADRRNPSDVVGRPAELDAGIDAPRSGRAVMVSPAPRSNAPRTISALMGPSTPAIGERRRCWEFRRRRTRSARRGFPWCSFLPSARGAPRRRSTTPRAIATPHLQAT